MLSYTATSVSLTARHADPVGDEGEHIHTWLVWACYGFAEAEDLRRGRAALTAVLAPLQGTLLPPGLWGQEDIAVHVLARLKDAMGVIVERPGYRCELWL